MTSPRRIALLLPLVAAAACTGRADYPSLAPRPIETVRFAVAPSAEPPAPPAETSPDIAVQLAAAEAARDDFAAQLALAERTVSAAGPAGSESWIEAQNAVSRLDRAATPAAVALGVLDRLMIDAAAAPQGAPPALAEAWEQVSAIVAGQRAAVEALADRLPAS
jgi:hypothetical protein